MTGMPNFANQTLQTDAVIAIEGYLPLIQSGCHPNLQFLLCSVYLPMCVPQGQQRLIGPCRPECESVRKRCEPRMNVYHIEWPAVLECSRFPEKNIQPHMCIEVPKGGAEGQFSLEFPPSSFNSGQCNISFLIAITTSYNHNLQNAK